MRVTGKPCDKVILFFWTCAPDNSGEGGGVGVDLDSWRWDVKSQGVLKSNTRGLRVCSVHMVDEVRQARTTRRF